MKNARRCLKDGAIVEPLKNSGYGFYASDLMQSMRHFSYEELLEREMVWVATPAQITRKLEDFHDKSKFNARNIVSHYGDIAPWKAYRTQELFARSVMLTFT